MEKNKFWGLIYVYSSTDNAGRATWEFIYKTLLIQNLQHNLYFPDPKEWGIMQLTLPVKIEKKYVSRFGR